MSYNSNYGPLQQRYYQNMDGFQLSQISQTSPQYLKYKGSSSRAIIIVNYLNKFNYVFLNL